MSDTTKQYQELTRNFARNKKPVPVSFRDLVPWIPYNSSRFTHQIHSYPAKVIPQIPHFFIQCKELIPSVSSILDPFGGSGTVALESFLGGHKTYSSDTNPLARLITKVKTTPISPDCLDNNYKKVRDLLRHNRDILVPTEKNIEYWYHTKTIHELGLVAGTIQKVQSPKFKSVCLVALSTTARKLSLADPRISVPVKLNPERYSKTHPRYNQTVQALLDSKKNSAIDVFLLTLNSIINQIKSLWTVRETVGKVEKIYHDSLQNNKNSISFHPLNSLDAIITSPPYLGAQKYIRASSLGLAWLSLTPSTGLRSLERKTIGREYFSKNENIKSIDQLPLEAQPIINRVRKKNHLRAQIAEAYLVEMREVLQNCNNILKTGGSLILVSGCNMICGESFDTTSYLKRICIDTGLTPTLELTDVIKSRGLMTRRNKTASVIPLESVTIFRK